MRIGTKSVLFGAHAFWLHPFFVAWAWTKMYGFPKQLWLWIAFFVHDIGYFGKPNMDGEEGEKHPLVGAQLLYTLEHYVVKFLKWQGVSARTTGAWGNEVLWHSRFWAQSSGRIPSDLCWADKYAFVLTPWWLYLPMVRLTGEIREYQQAKKHIFEVGEFRDTSWANDRAWHKAAVIAIKKIALEKVHATAAQRT